MKKISLVLIAALLAAPMFAVEAEFLIDNSVYAYNGESGTYWDETRYTITYFEDLFQPTLYIRMNERVSFKFGIGMLIPFNQEDKIINYYPYAQTRVDFENLWLELGSLSGNHDFPTPILDPLINMTPQIRVIATNRVPIPYEEFPVTGLFSHGKYEYGIALGWDALGTGELYMNWQLPDTTNHRERFDVGLTHNTADTLGVPLYAGLHYWHNGGHENLHTIWITENYVGAIGIRNDSMDILYLASYFLPDRDSHPEDNVFGHALYLSKTFSPGKWRIRPELFISGEFLNTNHVYISIEGDPFFRIPFYLGCNFYRDIELADGVVMTMKFVNGIFLPDTSGDYEWRNLRYDQCIQIDFEYGFDLGQNKEENENVNEIFPMEEQIETISDFTQPDLPQQQ